MIKGQQARERVFNITMWVVSVVFAGFLIGLGGLIIGDLPRVADPVQVEDFVDADARAGVDSERARLDAVGKDMEARMSAADQALVSAINDTQAAQETFNNYIATRTATTDAAQDPEVIARNARLEALREAERQAQAARDAIAVEQNAHWQAQSANEAAQREIESNAYPAFERARFVQELQVFGLRLAFTLPLLAVGALFLFQKNKGDYWPLKRGFILFAAFAFFVELVPYLPEYGGYVRYAVGIGLTILASHFVIKWMRNYLKAREAAEAKAETERKRSIQYEEALKKIAAHTCPGCDRTIAGSETPADFCMHCGMQLYDHCPACTTRKFAFFRYCMRCGAPARAEGAAG